jgi:hypothetical protein
VQQDRSRESVSQLLLAGGLLTHDACLMKVSVPIMRICMIRAVCFCGCALFASCGMCSLCLAYVPPSKNSLTHALMTNRTQPCSLPHSSSNSNRTLPLSEGWFLTAVCR